MTSRGAEILLTVDREGPESLQAQIERQIREAVRSGALRPGAGIPSTRDLAQELGVSRPIVVDAYSQLAAEGYLALRQGATPRVSELMQKPAVELPADPLAIPAPRYDFRIGAPDLTSFPRNDWAKSAASALAKMEPTDFGYTSRHGAEVLRAVLADYLGRVRGVTADPRQILVVGGFDQARTYLAQALWRRGVRRLATEEPSYADRRVLTDMGFEILSIPVDGEGIVVEALAASRAEAVMLTPAHQYPAGAVMSGQRRLDLIAWLRKRDAIAIEDDYDAEYRYDRAPVGALQGLDPARIVYIGTVSKTLAPALRLGWIVSTPELLPALRELQHIGDNGRSRIEQHTMAEFIRTGGFDRHLRRMRLVYRDRRAALLEALADELPETVIGGISAGLHATVSLPNPVDEAAVLAQAAKRDIGLSFMSAHFFGPKPLESTMLLSYARQSEAAIRTGVRGIAAVLHG